MSFDPLLDKPFIDLHRELEAIKNGEKKHTKSHLFKKLDRLHQKMYKKNEKQFIKYIEAAYEEHHLNKSVLDVTSESHDAAFILTDYKFLKKFHNLLQVAYPSKLKWTAEYCVLQPGTSFILISAVFLSFKRFHKEFGLKDFLYCYILDEGYDPLVRQMVASRLNFILEGSYLPIIAIFVNKEHATTLLILPIHKMNKLTWHFIHINPNGMNDDYDERFNEIPGKSCNEYERFFADQEDKTDYKVSHCVANIQKNYGTCVPWSILLVIEIFANIDILLSNSESGDFISLFCENLAERNANELTLHRFNRHIVELIYSFQCLVLDTYIKAANPENREIKSSSISNEPPLFANTGALLIPTFQNFAREILYGEPHKTLKLDLVIFDSIRKIQSRLRKNIEKMLKKHRKTSPQLHDDGDGDDDEKYETEEETEEEKTYKRHYVIETSKNKLHKTMYSITQEELVTLKEEIERLEKNTSDEIILADLKQKFKDKSKELFSKIDRFAEYHHDLRKWLIEWFHEQLNMKIQHHLEKIRNYQTEISEIEMKLRELELEIDEFNRKYYDKSNTEDADEFLTFVQRMSKLPRNDAD